MPALRACLSVMMPWEVEMMATPRPPRTFGSSLLPRYRRRPERGARFSCSLTGRPSKYFSTSSRSDLCFSPWMARRAARQRSSLRTVAMATLILEDGSFTVGLPTAAAFLMRTSMSAMGSVMLMKGSLSAPISAFAKSGLSREGPGPLKRCRQAGQARNHSRKPARVGPASVSVAAGAALPFLPAGLAQARHVATHGGFAQHVAAQAELAVHAARAARQFAAVALAA